MIPAGDLALFALAALIMVLTPGPNMVYLVSRSLCQGQRAGVTSLFGVATGFLVHMFAAAAGLTAVFIAVPIAYDLLRWLGAAYLLWLAWQALRPGARSPFEARDLPADSPARLYFMGFMTSALNPKIAMFYLSVFPQFVRPEYGSVFAQSAWLGLTRGTTGAHLARAALESIAFQTRDVVVAMERDARSRIRGLRVDGGAAANDLLMQMQADLLGMPITRPAMLETTALGAALLAGIGAGIWSERGDVPVARAGERVFRPRIGAGERRERVAAWDAAVSMLLR